MSKITIEGTKFEVRKTRHQWGNFFRLYKSGKSTKHYFEFDADDDTWREVTKPTNSYMNMGGVHPTIEAAVHDALDRYASFIRDKVIFI